MWWIIKNSAAEGPGLLLDELRSRNLDFRILSLPDGDELPPLSKVDGAIILGGPMNVDEVDLYPYLASEKEWVRDVIASGKPLLGLCLGGQMIARALEAEVRANTKPEIGFFPVKLTKSGTLDPLLQNLPSEFPIFHWHGDRFEIPNGCENLAASDLCDHQAFRAGRRAYALQFHPEVTRDIIDEWRTSSEIDIAQLPQAHAAAATIFRNFFNL